MRSMDCKLHIKDCALREMIAELDHYADDDREALTEEAWETMMLEAVDLGDEFYDYDGSLTSVAVNSMCF